MFKHYDETHKDLKALGLDLTGGAGVIQIGGANGNTIVSEKNVIKGKISTGLLNQIMMISLLNKNFIR